MKEDNIKIQEKSSENNEGEIIGKARPFTYEQNMEVLKQQQKALCKIKSNVNGSGFLCHIPFPVLITNNHVLSEKHIQVSQEIEISFGDGKEPRTIIIDENRKVITFGKVNSGKGPAKDVDVTIIEVRPKEDQLEDQIFLYVII